MATVRRRFCKIPAGGARVKLRVHQTSGPELTRVQRAVDARYQAFNLR